MENRYDINILVILHCVATFHVEVVAKQQQWLLERNVVVPMSRFILFETRYTVQISTAAPPAGVQQPFTHCTGLTQKNYSDYSMLP